LGIQIHQLKDQNGNSDIKGNINFGIRFRDGAGDVKWFGERFPIYDWVNHDGYSNFGNWVETAAKKAGK